MKIHLSMGVQAPCGLCGLRCIRPGVRDAFAQQLMGAPLDILNAEQEVHVIKSGIIAALEATDKAFLSLAQPRGEKPSGQTVQPRQYGFKDGASALVAVLMHGFQAAVPGQGAKLFAAWSGMGHMLLLRGRQVLRCTEARRPQGSKVI